MLIPLVCILMLLVPGTAWASDAPPELDPNALGALILAHKWVAVAAVIIALLVRLQKANKLPGLNWVPANYRPFLALFLGILSGVLTKIAGDPRAWVMALLDGVLAAIIAITAHDTIIEGVRAGREVGTPKVGPVALEKVIPVTDADGKKIETLVDSAMAKGPTLKIPPVLAFFLMPLAFVAALDVLDGCALFTPAVIAQGGLVAKDIACIIEHAYIDDATLNALCDLKTAERQVAGHALAASYREGVVRDAVTRPEVCAPILARSSDAGAAKDDAK